RPDDATAGHEPAASTPHGNLNRTGSMPAASHSIGEAFFCCVGLERQRDWQEKSFMRTIARCLATTSLVLITAAIALPAWAGDVDATSTIDSVTVYPDGASVTRVITLDLPSGDSTLVARDFPLTLDASSLRVEGEADARLTIGPIDARPPR